MLSHLGVIFSLVWASVCTFLSSFFLTTRMLFFIFQNKVIQMFGRQLAIRHRQNDNEINEELEQFPNFQMWLYVMDIHDEAKEVWYI